MNTKPPSVDPLAYFATPGTIPAAEAALKKAHAAIVQEFPGEREDEIERLLKQAFQQANISDPVIDADVLVARYKALRPRAS